MIGFWDILCRLLDLDNKTQSEHDKEKKEVDEQFIREKAEKQPSANKYGTKLSKSPLGDKPILLVKISANANENGSLNIKLQDEDGQTIDISSDSKTMISLKKLLWETVQKAKWDLKLE